MTKQSENIFKKSFEANMLDGDDLDDCGGAMLDAEDVFEWFQSQLLEIVESLEKLKREEYWENGSISNLVVKSSNETLDKAISIIKGKL